MQLKFLTGDACPVCGDVTVVSEWVATETLGDATRVLRHVNGGIWEHRQFACGQVLEYVPNFSRTLPSDRRGCQRNPELLIRREALQRVKETLESTLAAIDVPILLSSDRESVLAAIRSIRMPS